MLNILVSYFYQIRFFEPWIIPISTAVWDPKWYHQMHDQKFIFTDKRGVVNGIRYEPLMPGKSCDGLCRGPETCPTKDPSSCPFLKEYKKQLDAIDIEKMEEDFKKIANWTAYKKLIRFDSIVPVFALIVHETPANPCSERQAILKWSEENGLGIREFDKEKIEEYLIRK